MADEENGLRERMLAGEAPSSEDDWRELGVLLSGLVHIANAIGAELDAVEEALDAQSKQIEALVGQSSPDLRALFKAAGIGQ